jgi:HK97 family phage portal protein
MVEPHYPESGNQFIDYYTYTPNGIPLKIDPSDVLHTRFGIDPENTRKGMAPLKSLFREVFTDDEAANFSASLLRNMGIPGVIISPGTDNVSVDQTDKLAVKEQFKAKFGGDRRGEPLVMSAKTDIKTFGFSPAEMDLGKLREIPEERVSAILGVPAAVVGFGTGLQQTKVGATMKEMREAAYEDCIIPMQNLFSDELNSQLLPDFEENPDEWEIDFDLSQIRVLQEDENARAERVRGLVKDLLLTQGEGRSELGYEVSPEHDVYLMPFNIMPTPAGDMGKQPEPATPAGNLPPKFCIPVLEIKSVGWRARLVREFNKSLERLTAIFSRELQKVFNNLGDSAADIFEQSAASRDVETLAADTPQTKTNQDSFYADLIANNINSRLLNYDKQYLRVANDVFKTVNSITGLGVNLTDKIELDFIKLGGTRLGLIDLKAQTRDAVFQALESAREAGEGPYQAAIRIRDKVAAGPWSTPTIRANIIARTETKYAQNQSSVRAYKEGGCSQVEIVDGQLPTSDQDCIARNGKIISIEEASTLDEHPNGTLSFTPVIGDL